MNKPTVISLFSGGGGFDVGAMQAGFEIACGLEREANIAKYYELNLGHKPIIDSIENVQPSQFDCRPDWLHASPPCQGDSVARSAIKSPHADIDAGLEVCRFVRAWKPKYFTLENVVGYRHNKSLYAIENCLLECGYWVRRVVLDASDYGVPQSRVRLWAVASRVGIPMLPALQKRMGWYAAIEDLIPTLKECSLARWQVRDFAHQLPKFCDLLAGGNTSATRRGATEPAMTMCKKSLPKIFFQSGKVLATTPRCAADFQTFPRSYQLPKDVQTAGAIVGNAVPCQLSKLIGKSLLQEERNV